MENETETYSVECECVNCGWTGFIDIPKGTPVGKVECPECKVVALSKKKEQGI